VNALVDRGELTVEWTIDRRRRLDTATRNSSGSGIAAHLNGGGQLIVLGESQSGKTTLATKVVDDLDSSAPAKQPVLLNLATWNPSEMKLKPWMLLTIQRTYGLSPFLTESTEQALDSGMIIPVFDGIDEIDPGKRDLAARSIHQLFRDAPVMLTSRSNPESEHAARSALPAADIIRLVPISVSEVSRYLLRDVRDGERSRWRSLIETMKDDEESEVSKALSSPLIAWLAKIVYSGSSERLATEMPNPTELHDVIKFPNRDSIETHLLSNLAIAVFKRIEPSASPRFPPEDADKWLAFLANRASRRRVAFWEFRNYAPVYRLSLALAAISGAVIALLGIESRYFAGSAYLLLIAGSIFGYAWARGYTTERTKGDEVSRPEYGYSGLPPKDGGIKMHLRRLAGALGFVLVAYCTGLLTEIASTGSLSWLYGMSGKDVIVGAFFSVPVSFLAAYIGARLAGFILRRDSERDAKMGANAGDPLNVIEADRKSGGVIFGISSGMLAAGYLVYHLIALRPSSVWAIILAPLGGCVATCMWDEWAPFKAAHIWLVLRGSLPLQLVSFLKQCHDGGILRKNGNYFEFRHLRLQDGLASRARRKSNAQTALSRKSSQPWTWRSSKERPT
jgi:hypothetical protein